jgi:Phasin protein
MTQTEKSTASAIPNSFAADFSKAGKKHVEAISAMQADVFKELQEIGEHWTARAKSESDLASELLGKLTSARSIPEAATAYQDWAIRRAQMAVEDGQRLFTDNVKLMETAARLLSNGGVRGST